VHAVTSQHEEILAATEDIVPSLAAHAAASEKRRSLAPESVLAMERAGLWRLLTPKRWGGLEADFRTQVVASAILTKGDPAAGWLLVVINAHAFVLPSFPPKCQEEVFGPNPDARIPGTLASQGKARAVDGGWIVNGRWQFASGVDHGHWLLIGALQEVEGPPRGVHLVLPKEDAVVDDTWFTLGLRGTGSKDLVLENVFVPEHRSMMTGTLFDGRSPHLAMHPSYLFRMPVLPTLNYFLGGPLIGLAKQALRLHVERSRSRRDIYTGRAKAGSVGGQIRIAEGSAETATAELLLDSIGARFAALVAAERLPTIEERAELKWHATYAAELCRRATQRIFEGAGAHAVYDTAPIQATFRDLNTAARHAVADFDTNAEMFGRVTLGLDPGTPIV
jgi:alkylation response protein AidB-like acyl-CoA dehydrogenase